MACGLSGWGVGGCWVVGGFGCWRIRGRVPTNAPPFQGGLFSASRGFGWLVPYKRVGWFCCCTRAEGLGLSLRFEARMDLRVSEIARREGWRRRVVVPRTHGEGGLHVAAGFPSTLGPADDGSRSLVGDQSRHVLDGLAGTEDLQRAGGCGDAVRTLFAAPTHDAAL